MRMSVLVRIVSSSVDHQIAMGAYVAYWRSGGAPSQVLSQLGAFTACQSSTVEVVTRASKVTSEHNQSPLQRYQYPLQRYQYPLQRYQYPLQRYQRQIILLHSVPPRLRVPIPLLSVPTLQGRARAAAMRRLRRVPLQRGRHGRRDAQRHQRRADRDGNLRGRCGGRGASPVPAQMRQGRAPSRCRCGRGESSPGADAAGASPVPAQMRQGRAQSRCRCGEG
jgi:hypothetical protein